MAAPAPDVAERSVFTFERPGRRALLPHFALGIAGICAIHGIVRISTTLAVCLLLGCTEDPAPALARGPPPPQPKAKPAAVVAAAPPASGFDGVVVGADGGPLAAHLQLVPGGKKAPIELDTDEVGAFSQPELEAGEYEMRVTAPGEYPTRAPIYLPQHGFKVRMSAGREVFVTVVDGPAAKTEAQLKIWAQTRADGGWEGPTQALAAEGKAAVRAPFAQVYVEAAVGSRCAGAVLSASSDGVLTIDLKGSTAKGRAFAKHEKGAKRFPELGKGWSLRAVPSNPSGSSCVERTSKILPNGNFALEGIRFDQKHRLDLIDPRGKSQVLLRDDLLAAGMSIWWNPTRPLVWVNTGPNGPR